MHKKWSIIGLQRLQLIFFFCSLAINSGSADVKLILSGGNPIASGDFPWLVGIVNESSQKLFCGGSIITENFIITAGRCVHELLPNGTVAQLQPNALKVIAGDNKRMEDEKTEQTVKVVEIHLHPQFTIDGSYYGDKTGSELNLKKEQKGFNKDFALLKVSPQINFTESVKPIAVINDFNLEKPEMISIGGWGITDKKQNTIPTGIFLKKVEIPYNSGDDSNKFGFYLKEGKMEFDTGLGNNKGLMGACIGDTGGPLVCHSNALCGVISFGIWCDRYYPTGQSNLIDGDVAHWINSVINPKLWAYLTLAAVLSTLLVTLAVIITLRNRKRNSFKV